MEFSDYLETRDSADALTGSEIVGISQVGDAKKTTVQAIADLAGGTQDLESVLTEGNSLNSPFSIDIQAGAALTIQSIPTPALNLAVGESAILLNAPNTTLQADGSTGAFSFIDARATPVGIQYDADYSGTFSERSLIDKAYADSLISGDFINNGSPTTLLNNTVIDGDLGAYDFNFSAIASMIIGIEGGAFEIGTSDGDVFEVGGGSIVATSGDIGLTVTNGFSLLFGSRLFALSAAGWQLDFGSDATGDIPYRDASGFLVRRAIGTPGQVLTSVGTPALPTWSDLPVSNETTSGIVELATAAETITGTDNTIATHPAGVHEKVVGLQDLFIPASAMWPRVTAGCSYLTRTEIATSLFNIQSLDFDTTTQEFAQFQISLPRNWNNGTITAKVYWTAASGTGTVQWGISGGAYSNDDALTVAFGTAQTVDDTLITANDLHITDATSAITLAGTPADADFIALQVSRNPASDTLDADAKLLGVVITITTDAAKAA